MAILDFVNTVSDWVTESPREDLPSFASAIELGVRDGWLTKSEAQALLRLPQQERELAQLHALRKLVHDVFAAIADGEAPSDADLEVLSRRAAAGERYARLRSDRGKVSKALALSRSGIALLRHRLIAAAVELLLSPSTADVKACPSCGWLFLDTSKNRSRRWCSMEACGAAAKAKAYYERSRKRATARGR